jgi:hypothetical protein
MAPEPALADTDVVRCTIDLKGHANMTVAEMRTIRQLVVDLWLGCDARGLFLSGGVQPSFADVP